VDLRTVRTIRSTLEIRAPIDVVWQVLTDFAAYPAWNPHVRQISGQPGIGQRLTLVSHPPGGRPMRFRPLIIAWRPPHELRWRTTFVTRAIFTAEHGFRLEPIDDERVRFVQDETFRGLAVPLYSHFRLSATRRGFDRMSQALREQAEQLASEIRIPAQPTE
jgi:hypothetical protein